MQSFRRKAASLEALREEVLLAYGPRARIVDATRITRRGLGRFFANDEIEATIEVPDSSATPSGGFAPERIDRAGIAALLADADVVENAASAAAPSTASPAFAAVLAEVERGLGVPIRSAPPPTPTLELTALPAPVATPALPQRPAADSTGSPAASVTAAAPRLALAPSPGDFVLFVGLAGDALSAARAIGAGLTGIGVDQCTIGPKPRLVPGGGVIAGRRDELLQRAASIDRGRALFASHATTLDDSFEAIAELRPDEVWAVVDASRRAADTEEWVARLSAAIGVHAIAVIGASLTREPAPVGRLGIPIGWTEPETRRRRA